LVGCIPCVEPIYKNIYVKSNKEGEFVVVNKYLVEDLKALGLWDAGMLNKLKYYDGSIQEISGIPEELKHKYKEVFEIDGRWLIEAAARRGRWMDQSQSLNIFYSGTSGRELSELYFLAWERGLKTTYYLRTLGASQVEKASVEAAGTQTRESRSASEVITETVVVETVVEAPVAAATPMPLTPATKFDQEYLAKVAAGEAVGVCESCEA
jgi:ribonucleoside-diphosphate reductase alpha chain